MAKMVLLVARKVWRFVRRHRWSLPLAAGSLWSFVELAEEMREGEIAAFDAAVASNVVAWRGSLDWIMVAVTKTAEFEWMAIACVGAVVALFLLRLRREAAFVATCGLAAAVLSAALKLVFQRTRPDAVTGYLVELPGSFSFPSGHAMSSACVAGSLAIVAFAKLSGPWRWLAVVAAFFYILGVGLSRIYLGVHYASDVLGGQLASAALVAATTGWFFPRLLPGEATQHAARVPTVG
jgi:membrane-associated phospholipid phosphatase